MPCTTPACTGTNCGPTTDSCGQPATCLCNNHGQNPPPPVWEYWCTNTGSTLQACCVVDDTAASQACAGVQCGERVTSECNSAPVQCGICPSGQTCNPSGQCITCTLQTCNSLGKQCGNWDNGCGWTIMCAGCSGSQTCDATGHCIAPATPAMTATSTASLTICLAIGGAILMGWKRRKVR